MTLMRKYVFVDDKSPSENMLSCQQNIRNHESNKLKELMDNFLKNYHNEYIFRKLRK